MQFNWFCAALVLYMVWLSFLPWNCRLHDGNERKVPFSWHSCSIVISEATHSILMRWAKKHSRENNSLGCFFRKILLTIDAFLSLLKKLIILKFTLKSAFWLGVWRNGGLGLYGTAGSKWESFSPAVRPFLDIQIICEGIFLFSL